ncbi:44510_t:CDS:1 [Gigaspora margarita]|uniref:44510_t:CDS:1 n=1 Tax=Gigaspora margarita TaxID=4874 RepID=A0ABM8W487_GIGMA|nr:44510_t:CDS:1 [Gigaspora margarita]
MPYVAPKVFNYTPTSLNVKQAISIAGNTRPRERPSEVLGTKNIITKNKSESQTILTRDAKRENLSTSTRLTHTENFLLRKKNGEIIKSSFKKFKTKSVSSKSVRFSNELKHIRYDDDFSDNE